MKLGQNWAGKAVKHGGTGGTYRLLEHRETDYQGCFSLPDHVPELADGRGTGVLGQDELVSPMESNVKLFHKLELNIP